MRICKPRTSPSEAPACVAAISGRRTPLYPRRSIFTRPACPYIPFAAKRQIRLQPANKSCFQAPRAKNEVRTVKTRRSKPYRTAGPYAFSVIYFYIYIFFIDKQINDQINKITDICFTFFSHSVRKERERAHKIATYRLTHTVYYTGPMHVIVRIVAHVIVQLRRIQYFSRRKTSLPLLQREFIYGIKQTQHAPETGAKK